MRCRAAPLREGAAPPVGTQPLGEFPYSKRFIRPEGQSPTGVYLQELVTFWKLEWLML
jgi:hypothetical protein